MPNVGSKQLTNLSERHKRFNISDEADKNRYLCVVCKDILVEPHQSNCGCRYCHECIKHCQNMCIGCPSGPATSTVSFFHDRAMEKELIQLKMKCPNDQCKEIFDLKYLNNHLQMCKIQQNFDDVDNEKTCPDCTMKMTMKNFETLHKNANASLDTICGNWRSLCPFKCSGEIQNNLKQHLQCCAEVNIECPKKDYGCDQMLTRRNMEGHIKEHFRVDTAMSNLSIKNHISNFGVYRYSFTDVLTKMQTAKDSVQLVLKFTDNAVILGYKLVLNLSLSRILDLLILTLKISKNSYIILKNSQKKIALKRVNDRNIIPIKYFHVPSVNNLPDNGPCIVREIDIETKDLKENGQLDVEVEILDVALVENEGTILENIDN